METYSLRNPIQLYLLSLNDNQHSLYYNNTVFSKNTVVKMPRKTKRAGVGAKCSAKRLVQIEVDGPEGGFFCENT